MFNSIYKAIEFLSQYTEFNALQVDTMLRAVVNNDLFQFLKGNMVIRKFYERIIQTHYENIDKDLTQKVTNIINASDSTDHYSNVSKRHDYFKTYKEKARKIAKQNCISRDEAFKILAKHVKCKDWIYLQEKLESSLEKLFAFYHTNPKQFIFDGFNSLQSEYLSLLKYGVEKDNIRQFILENSYVDNRFSLSNVYLRGLDFDYRKQRMFSNIIENWNWCSGKEINLSHAVFACMEFTWSVFIDSNFEYTQFCLRSEATKRVLYPNHFQAVVFINCNLANSDLSESYARDSLFFNCQFNNADLSGLKGFMAIFSYCNMKGARFHNAGLMASNFDFANLTEAQFVNTNLRGASLRFADLKGTNFYNADLRGADLTGCVNASFEGALLDEIEIT
ncbi:MAG: pentapeptide repeat-containing protein [Tatlockia sp.]|nr:pentapeptide repeat-containing protein [Tatlockia sp.]